MGLERVRTPFVIVGGIGTALYMPQRFTLDLDLLVLSEDAPRLYQELTRLGYTKQGQPTIGGTIWRGPNGNPLAVLESAEPWARPAVQTPNRSPTGEPVIALPYLVLMKLAASRSQDLADISRMLGTADERTLQEVRNVVRAHRSADEADLESLIMLGRLELESGGRDQPDGE